MIHAMQFLIFEIASQKCCHLKVQNATHMQFGPKKPISGANTHICAIFFCMQYIIYHNLRSLDTLCASIAEPYISRTQKAHYNLEMIENCVQ